MNKKRFNFGFLGLLGFLGFQDPWYFLFFLFFLFFVPTPKPNKGEDSPIFNLIEHQKKQKAEHLQKITQFISQNKKITNNDVEKLTGVSHATAERYLQKLEKKGQLKQMGEIGQAVYYVKPE